MKLIIALIGFLFFFHCKLFGQADSLFTLKELHPAVGNTISREEKIRYHLFSFVAGADFDSARFYQRGKENGYQLIIYKQNHSSDSLACTQQMFSHLYEIVDRQNTTVHSEHKFQHIAENGQRINFYFGIGGRKSAAGAELKAFFSQNGYMGYVSSSRYLADAHIGGDPNVEEGASRFNVGFDVNAFKRIKFGLGMYKVSAKTAAYKGSLYYSYQSITESIDGTTLQLYGAYQLVKAGRPNFFIECQAGVGALANLCKINTEIFVMDTSVKSIGSSNSKKNIFNENPNSIGFYANFRTDLYMGKIFSIYLSLCQSFDSGIKIEEKSESVGLQTAYIPEHKIYFNAFRVNGGLAFHIY